MDILFCNSTQTTFKAMIPRFFNTFDTPMHFRLLKISLILSEIIDSVLIIIALLKEYITEYYNMELNEPTVHYHIATIFYA